MAWFLVPLRNRRPYTSIKICGVMSMDIASAAIDAGADAIGLVLAPCSPRRIDHELAMAIAVAIPPTAAPVAVFQNQAVNEILSWPQGWIQIHGEATEADIQAIADCSSGRSIIRGFRFSERELMRWSICPNVTAVLVDGSDGGAGVGFPHEDLAALIGRVSKPVILAGGLTPENVGEAIRTVRPYAVDVSSGVESAPGVKEPSLIHKFCAAVREADRAIYDF